MNKLGRRMAIAVTGATLALGGTFITPAYAGPVTVGPITETRVHLVDDGTDGTQDMTGPGVGMVRYHQEADGSLTFTVRGKGAPSTTYDVDLVCGPSHDLECGSITLAQVNTNGAGAFASTQTVPVSDLQTLGGSGYQTNHIDIFTADGMLTAGAINYFIPGATAGPSNGKQVGPSTTTTVPVIQDSTNSLTRDMTGPVIGTLQYSQSSDGSLLVTVSARHVVPSTTFDIYFECGPAHNEVCSGSGGELVVGSFASDANGNVLANFTVPAADILVSGSGYRTDHIDMFNSDFTNAIVAGAINYYLPGGAPASSPRGGSESHP